jgi:hypothetical protein
MLLQVVRHLFSNRALLQIPPPSLAHELFWDACANQTVLEVVLLQEQTCRTLVFPTSLCATFDAVNARINTDVMEHHTHVHNLRNLAVFDPDWFPEHAPPLHQDSERLLDLDAEI